MKEFIADIFYGIGEIAFHFDWGRTYQWAMRCGYHIETGERIPDWWKP